MPPAAPEDVLSVWHSPPSPQGYPPNIADKINLGKYGSSNYEFETNSFFLVNCQWIDIVVKSKNIPMYFCENKAGAINFGVTFRLSEHSGFSPDAEDVGIYPGGMASPLVGNMLYPYPYYQETHTGSDTIYVMAVRLFAEGGREGGNWLGSECILSFANYNVDKEADVSYEVYKLVEIPSWGYEGEYWKDILIPWLQQWKTETEQEQMLDEWYEQFK